ncbi:hypothetical protein TorRG33x02_100730 [Trema orientale]|uniref:Uncharacterized protein n=1 Tax=Trema orientale TaxID=63057 RepID=A0A2P5F8D0_TREOI|nr:hypothetical protein TorRG33x02_100730 [Trema orientale]
MTNINSRFMFLLSLVFAATIICTAQQTLRLTLSGTLTFDDGSTPTVADLTIDGGTLTVDGGTSITINGGTLTVNGGTDLIVAGDTADVTLTGDIGIADTRRVVASDFTVSSGTLTFGDDALIVACGTLTVVDVTV